MAANDHLAPCPPGAHAGRPEQWRRTGTQKGRAALLTIPRCPEMPRVRREERLAIAPAGHPGAVLLQCEVGDGGSGRRHAPIPEAAASPSRDVAARATHAICPKPPPGRSRSPTARCTPAAMIDVAARSRSPAGQRQRDRDLGSFPDAGPSLLGVCTAPCTDAMSRRTVQKSRVRDSTLPFTGWRSSSADCAPPRPCQWRQWGHRKGHRASQAASRATRCPATST